MPVVPLPAIPSPTPSKPVDPAAEPLPAADIIDLTVHRLRASSPPWLETEVAQRAVEDLRAMVWACEVWGMDALAQQTLRLAARTLDPEQTDAEFDVDTVELVDVLAQLDAAGHSELIEPMMRAQIDLMQIVHNGWTRAFR
jgi:hypothetical protein